MHLEKYNILAFICKLKLSSMLQSGSWDTGLKYRFDDECIHKMVQQSNCHSVKLLISVQAKSISSNLWFLWFFIVHIKVAYKSIIVVVIPLRKTCVPIWKVLKLSVVLKFYLVCWAKKVQTTFFQSLAEQDYVSGGSILQYFFSVISVRLGSVQVSLFGESWNRNHYDIVYVGPWAEKRNQHPFSFLFSYKIYF